MANSREALRERVENDFTYHPPPDVETVALYEEIRTGFREVAIRLIAIVPPGRELSTALTKLEEACFWANAGIARAGVVAGADEKGDRS